MPRSERPRRQRRAVSFEGVRQPAEQPTTPAVQAETEALSWTGERLCDGEQVEIQRRREALERAERDAYERYTSAVLTGNFPVRRPPPGGRDYEGIGYRLPPTESCGRTREWELRTIHDIPRHLHNAVAEYVAQFVPPGTYWVALDLATVTVYEISDRGPSQLGRIVHQGEIRALREEHDRERERWRQTYRADRTDAADAFRYLSDSARQANRATDEFQRVLDRLNGRATTPRPATPTPPPPPRNQNPPTQGIPSWEGYEVYSAAGRREGVVESVVRQADDRMGSWTVETQDGEFIEVLMGSDRRLRRA